MVANRHQTLDGGVTAPPIFPLTIGRKSNGSENDIRCQVTKRKVSGGTRSDVGRDCRDAFLGLTKTCAKLGVAFWDYLGNRLGIAGQPAVPPLPDLIRCRGQPA
jgi:hypothetical protein